MLLPVMSSTCPPPLETLLAEVAALQRLSKEKDDIICHLQLQLAKNELDSREKIRRIEEKAEEKIEFAMAKCQEHLEAMEQKYAELEAELELQNCKKPIDDDTIDFDAESNCSGDDAPEPTSDFTSVPAEQLAKDFVMMSDAIGNAHIIIRGQELQIKQQLDWTKTFFKKNIDLLDRMTFGNGIPEDIQQQLSNVHEEKENTVQINKEYLTEIAENYNAGAESLDLENPESEKINAFIRDSTHGKLDNLVSTDSNSDAVALLVNAIYFKGKWDEEFEMDLTSPREFTLKSGELMAIPF
ncbi:hypothetical protein L5515_007051 [Caenorhabditis briggsae]|uniref:Serpin domain-containing protein n=1 Tax=Caenorhabditis briggsae TaxID=6238 RepID=A0AAE9F3I5_CAEBR|nr:hypothetical protein L5515_007051 [Caenorhabditis briggsae]